VNQLQFAGGHISKELKQEGDGHKITHVVVPLSTKRERLLELRGILSEWNGKIPRVVTTDWVDDSVRARTLVDEERFGAWIGQH